MLERFKVEDKGGVSATPRGVGSQGDYSMERRVSRRRVLGGALAGGAALFVARFLPPLQSIERVHASHPPGGICSL